MTKRALDFTILLFLPTIYAEYIRSDQLAQVWASNDRSNFENTTEEVQKRSSSDQEKWPNRYVDGMYGIGSQDYIITEEVVFLGFDSFENSTDAVRDWFDPGNEFRNLTLGCDSSDYQNVDVANKIVFVNRGTCSFSQKGITASDNGAAGVVIVNVGNQVVRMDMKELMNQSRKIVAISLYQSTAGEILQDTLALGELDEKLYLRLYPSDNTMGLERIIVIIVSFSFLILLLISLLWVLVYYFQRFRLLHRQYAAQRKQEKQMKKAFKKMKVETLSQSSELVQNHEEVCCAICIDNFEAGAVVRHLTCAHVYHKKCIDPWLTEKGTCPQCKADILKSLGLGEAVQRPPPETATASTETYDSTPNVGSEPMNDQESATQTVSNASENQEAYENEAFSDAENAEESVEIENEVNVSVVRDSTPQQNALPEVSPETQMTEERAANRSAF